MKTICIINQKGGVSKTTTAINLSYYYQSKGYRVLAIDANEQSNLSATFIKEDLDQKDALYDFLTGDEKAQVTQIYPNLDIIPANDAIAGLDSFILTSPKAKFTPATLMRNVINSLAQNYDFCIIDCPAQTGLITANALAASDYVLIPVKTSQFSWDGLDKCIDYVLDIKEQLNPKLNLLGIILTFYQPRLNSSKETYKYMEETGAIKYLMDSTIRRSQDIVNIEKKGSIFELNKNSPVALDYKNLAEEILNKIK